MESLVYIVEGTVAVIVLTIIGVFVYMCWRIHKAEKPKKRRKSNGSTRTSE